jgi:hypothetical protein
LSGEPIQHRHYVLAAEALPHLHRDTLPGEHVDHSERAKPVPIYQLIGDKVQGPGFIRSRRRWPMGSDDHGFPPPRWPLPQRQAFFPVEAIHEGLAHDPAFSIEEHPNLAVAVPYSCLGDFFDPLPERRAGILMTPIPIRGPRAAGRPAGTPFTDVIGALEIRDHDPPLRRP